MADLMLCRYRAFNSPSLCAKLAERNSLLWGQVNNDEAIDACSMAVLKQTVLSVAQEWVVVTHKQDWGLEATTPGSLDHLQGRLDGDAIAQSNLFESGRILFNELSTRRHTVLEV